MHSRDTVSRTLVRYSAEPLEPRILLADNPPNLAYPLESYPLTTTPEVAAAHARGELYFNVGIALEHTDGSAEGTAGALDYRGRPLFGWNGEMYFQSLENETLYKFGPNWPIRHWVRHGNSAFVSATNFVPLGRQVFFTGRTQQDYDPDGVFVDTYPFATFVRPGISLGTIGGNVIISDDLAPSPGLWRSDGSDQRTVQLTQRVVAQSAAALDNDTLVLDAFGELWKTDGTDAGTARLASDIGDVTEWHHSGRLLYFLVGNGVWVTDGTEAGTVRLANALAKPTGTTKSWLASVGDTLYFLGPAPDRSTQLFSTRGPGTTQQVTGFAGATFTPGISAAGGKVFFIARAGSADTDLWVTDGSSGNHYRVPLAGDDPALPNTVHNLHALAASVFFTRRDGDGPIQMMRYGVAPAEIEGNTLVINGTDPAEGPSFSGDDIISLTVTRLGAALTATVNGADFEFPIAGLREIVVNGLGGSDALQVDPNLPVDVELTFNASSGDESFAIDGTDGRETFQLDNGLVVFGDAPSSDKHHYYFSGLESLRINALGGDDWIHSSGRVSRDVFIDAGPGDDYVQMYPQSDDARGPFGQFTAVGGGGADSLIFSLSHYAFGRVLEVSDAGVSFSPPTATYAFNNFSAGIMVRVESFEPEVVRLTPSVNTPFDIMGRPQDALVLRLDGVSGAALTRTTSESGRYEFDNRQPVMFSGITPDDMRPPAATSGRLVDWTRLNRIEVTFSEPIRLPRRVGEALLLVNTSTGRTLEPSAVGGGFNATTLTAFFTGILPGGHYRATLRAGSVTDYAGNPTTSDFTFEFDVAPRVAAVFADATTWTAAFRAHLRSLGSGDADFGYALMRDAADKPLPWTNMNRISVRFNGPVEANLDDLVLIGVNVPRPRVASFAYEPATFTATWTLATPLRKDRYLINLDGDPGGVRGIGNAGSAGALLDGEPTFSSPTGLPSGNSRAGGDFLWRFNVLPGDVDQNGTVQAIDFSTVKTRLFKSTLSPGSGSRAYSIFHDLDGSGDILADDFSAVKARLFDVLPPPAQRSVAGRTVSPRAGTTALFESTDGERSGR